MILEVLEDHCVYFRRQACETTVLVIPNASENLGKLALQMLAGKGEYLGWDLDWDLLLQLNWHLGEA